MLGAAHYIFALCSLALGGLILLLPKATRVHIWLGRIYIGSMFGVNLSGLGIYHLTGRVNIFHVLAVINLLIIGGGTLQIVYRRRIRNWLWRHYQYMTWSYVALLTAAGNEALSRIAPLQQFVARTTSALPLIWSLIVLAAAGAIIFSRQAVMLRKYDAASKRER